MASEAGVRVDNELSSWRDVKSGIPQGSVLGPTLFVIFINDMPDEIDSVCQLFADDAKIFRGIKSSNDIYTLQEDLDKLAAWSEKWQLAFNIEKCKSLHVGVKNVHHEYHMNGKMLKQIEDEKDLGVIIDEKLDFHRQTASVIKKANGVLGAIKRTFLKLDKNVFPPLFTSLVRTHLEYANVIWGPFFKGDIKAVEKVQRRATKMVAGIANMSYEERLKELQLPSLVHRRRRGDMIQMYKIVNGDVDVERELYVKLQGGRTRGHKFKLRKTKATKHSRVNVFSVRAIDNWNNLPAQAIEANSISTFKGELDKHWADQMYEIPF